MSFASEQVLSHPMLQQGGSPLDQIRWLPCRVISFNLWIRAQMLALYDFIMNILTAPFRFMAKLYDMTFGAVMRFFWKLWDASLGAIYNAIMDFVWKIYDMTFGAIQRLFWKLWDASLGALIQAIRDFIWKIYDMTFGAIRRFIFSIFYAIGDFFCEDYFESRDSSADVDVSIDTDIVDRLRASAM